MKKVLILGCTGATEFIVSYLMNSNGISEICICDPDKAKCDEIRKAHSGSRVRISTARADLANEAGTRMMLSIVQPEVIVNMSPSRFTITVMKLALEIGADYIDQDLFKPGEGGLLSEQFSYFGDFRSKGKMAVVGCAMNPSVITSLVRQAMREDFDTLTDVDFVEINLDINKESIIPAKYIEGGEVKECPEAEVSLAGLFPEVGTTTISIANNVVVEDFIKEIPEISNVRYFTSFAKEEDEEDFSDILEKIGMLSEEQIAITPEVSISPKEFWNLMKDSNKKEITLDGKCVIGVMMKGVKFGSPKTCWAYVIGDNDKCMEKYNMSAKEVWDAYAILSGTVLICNGKWNKMGVFSPVAFDPELLLHDLRGKGLRFEWADLPLLTSK
ncbi:MAG: saccharopine dehydrogenase NADP-binding domain-containing protein [Saccharofermentans sp.]|nr:saccharopine dehydrogenase NADP-binding domain-containing protein [Saccharofermentans sp.]